MTRRILAGAASAVLAGALLWSAPIASATNEFCGANAQCIDGVDASIDFGGSAVGQGGTARALVGTLVRFGSGSTFLPYIRVSRLCRSGATCSGTSLIAQTQTRVAVHTIECTGTTGTCVNMCTPTSSFGGNALTGFAVSNESSVGSSVGITPPDTTSSTNFATSNCSISNTLRFKNFYVAVIVPGTVVSGTYTGTVLFGIN